MKHLIKTACRMLSGFCTVLLFVVTLYALMSAVKEKRDGIPFFLLGYKPVVVLSDSMEPTMQTGSLIIVRDQKSQEPKTGDIILFRLGSKALATHRVIGQDEEGFITKGDNNTIQDPGRRSEKDIFGTVVKILN